MNWSTKSTLCALVAAITVAAAGQVPTDRFTGRWIYEETAGVKAWGRTDPHAPITTVTLELEANGNALTGFIHSHTTTTNADTGSKTVSAETRPAKISNGTIDGNNLSFDLESVIRGLGIKQTTHYTGILDHDTIQMTGSRYEGDFTYLDTGKKPTPSHKGQLLRTTMEVHRVSGEASQAVEPERNGGAETASAKSLSDAIHGVTDSQTKGAPSVWQIENITDRMTGKRSLQGFMRSRTDDSQQPGELQVTATCNTEALNFQIVFLSDAKPAIGLKQNGIGLQQNTIGTFGHAKPWVEMRVRIDNDPPRVVTSENDYLNYATIVFSKWTAQAGSREDGAASIVRYMLAAKSAGSIDKALQAHSILVELTTENNAKEYLEIHPQESSFKTFASSCGLANVLNPDGSINFTQVPHGPAADGFKFVYTLPLQQREYRGSVEGFVSEFPAFLQRAASVAGIADRDFSKETSFILDAVRTCGQITPEMATSVFAVKGTVWRKPDGIEELEKLGPQYEVCNTKNGLGVSSRVTGVPPELSRGIGLTIHPIGSYKMSNGVARWAEGKGFTVQVFFGQMKGDDRDMKGGRLQPTFDYEVIHAIIDSH